MLTGRLGLDKARIPMRIGTDWCGWIAAGSKSKMAVCALSRRGRRTGGRRLSDSASGGLYCVVGTRIERNPRCFATVGSSWLRAGRYRRGSRTLLYGPPLMPDSSAAARAQVALWADPKTRMG